MDKEKLKMAKKDQLEKNDQAKKQQLIKAKREADHVKQIKLDTISQVDAVLDAFNSIFTTANSIIKNLSDDVLQESLENIIRQNANNESDKLELHVDIYGLPKLDCKTQWSIDEQWLKTDYKNNIDDINEYAGKEINSYEEYKDFVYNYDWCYGNNIYSYLYINDTSKNFIPALRINYTKITEIKYDNTSADISANYFGRRSYFETLYSGNELIARNLNYVNDYLQEKGYDKVNCKKDTYKNLECCISTYDLSSTIFKNIFNTLNNTIQNRLQEFGCKILSDSIDNGTYNVCFKYIIKNPLMDED